MVKSSYMNSSDVDDSTLERITFTYDSLISNKDTPLIHKSTNLPKTMFTLKSIIKIFFLSLYYYYFKYYDKIIKILKSFL